MDWSLVWELFSYAILAALLAGITCPIVGSFLLVRRTGFYGVTLPQFAAFGLAFAYAILPWWIHNIGLAELTVEEALVSPHAISNYAIGWAAVFTFAGLFLLLAFGKRKETETARVAAAFAIAASGTLLLSVASPIGKDNIEALLRGELLTVDLHEFETIAVAYAVVLIVIAIAYRGLLLVSFDPSTARVLGIRVSAYEAVMLAIAGLTVSAGVLIVGPIVLFGLLVLPPLAAHGLARSMAHLIWLSIAIGILSSVGGMYVSFSRDLPLGPSVCLVSTVLLGLARLLRTIRS